MTCAHGYSGGSSQPNPRGVDPRNWRTFGELEDRFLQDDIPLEREAVLYGARPGFDHVGHFSKAVSDRLDISSVVLDLSVIDVANPPFSATDFMPLGAATDPAWIETDVDPGAGEQLERGLYLDGTGQLVLRALGLCPGTYASVLVRGYARISPPVSGAYFMAGFAFNSRAESSAGGIGQAITVSWYRRRGLGDPASPLTLTGPIQIQNSVADPTTAPVWEPWTLNFAAQRVNGAGSGDASVEAGGWRGFEAPPAGATGIGDPSEAIGWDHEDREVLIGAVDAELLVQQILVHSRGI